jgi:carboxyl-terminal processing protease
VGQGDEPSVSILHWSLSKAVGIIRGEKNTKVVLTIITAADPSGPTVKIDLIRDEVKLEERAAKSEIRTVEAPAGDLKIGVIDLPSFYSDLGARHRDEKDFRSASRDVDKILTDLKKEQVDGVILDLRGNSGGSLIEAIQMTGLFIKSGPVVIVRKNFGANLLEDEDRGISYSGPMVVLIDRLSASASEIVAAALQDYGRAVLVGDHKTHGKGTVQYVLRLGRDRKLGSLKITNALFYRVIGISTQLRGVEPDIEMPSVYGFAEMGEESLPNPLTAPVIDPVDFLAFDDLRQEKVLLRRKSLERRAAEGTYVTYTNLLSQVSEMSRADVLPLNIEERRVRARQRQRLGELQSKLAEGALSSADEEEATRDFVLLESLRVLRDLIELKAKTRSVTTR